MYLPLLTGPYGPPLTADEYAIGRTYIGRQPPGHLGNETLVRAPKRGKNLLANVFDTWPVGSINYKIDARFTATERTAIAGGLADITDHTCLRFDDAGSNPSGDHIFITTGVDSNGCFYQGGGYSQGTGAHILNLVQRPFCSEVSSQIHI